MRITIFVGLLLLILGGVIGFFFLRKDEVAGPQGPYPSELAQIKAPVNITEKGLHSHLQAASTGDLFYVQGLCHGRRGGTGLLAMRNLFRGGRAADLGEDLAQLAPLFYYLDLEFTAGESLALYPMEVQTILQRYAAGLTEGSGKEWQVEDVLLMQRGYAFLMGYGFAGEWTVNQLSKTMGQAAYSYTGFPPGQIGGVPDGIDLHGELDALFLGPTLGLAWFAESRDVLWHEARSIESLDWVFRTMHLEITNGLSARGLSLTGTPFLWSAETGTFQFSLFPIAANDEQFSLVPNNLFAATPELLLNNDGATHAGLYPGSPVHSDYGRRMDAVANMQGDTGLFYHWDGFRPSADLAALYFLLSSKTLEEARSALQFHQVPAVEVILRLPPGRTSRLSLLPSNPNQEREVILGRPQLFRSPFVRRTPPPKGFSGFNFKGQDIPKGHSQLDERLAGLLRFYVKGPLAASLENADLDQILQDREHPQRKGLLQAVWRGLFARFQQDFAEELDLPHLIGADLAVKRALLASLDREGLIAANPDTGAGGRRARMVEEVITQALPALKEGPIRYSVRQEGNWQPVAFPEPGPSSDAVFAPFWVVGGDRVMMRSRLHFAFKDDIGWQVEEESLSEKAKTWRILPQP